MRRLVGEESKYNPNYGKNVANFVSTIIGKDAIYIIKLYVESFLPDSVARTLKKFEQYKAEGTFYRPKDMLTDEVKYVWPTCYKEHVDILLQNIKLKSTALIKQTPTSVGSVN